MQNAECRMQKEVKRLKERAIAMDAFPRPPSPFRQISRSISSRQGFTLIEVLIAITVFSIGILAVAAMQSHSTSSNARAMAITHATTIASEEVEELQGLDYAHAYLVAGTHNPGVDAGLPPDPPGFDLSWQVTDNTPMDGVKQVVVTVQSTSGPLTTTNLTYYKIKTY